MLEQTRAVQAKRARVAAEDGCGNRTRTAFAVNIDHHGHVTVEIHHSLERCSHLSHAQITCTGRGPGLGFRARAAPHAARSMRRGRHPSLTVPHRPHCRRSPCVCVSRHCSCRMTATWSVIQWELGGTVRLQGEAHAPLMGSMASIVASDALGSFFLRSFFRLFRSLPLILCCPE